MIKQLSSIIPSAEPFLFKGNDIGVLLVHGFTGTPKEMRWMGEYMAQLGYTVAGIRLAGHATQPTDLLRMRWQDWLYSVEDGFCMLSSCTKEVFLIGLSMGGILSLLAASRLPSAGVVAMSTPYALPEDPRLAIIRLLARVQATVPKGFPDWHDLTAAKDHIDYPEYPTIGLAELKDLLTVMRQALPLISQPVLLIHSRQDTSVVPENAERIYSSLRTDDKHLEWVENSGHVITREPERQRVFQLAADFIDRISGRQK